MINTASKLYDKLLNIYTTQRNKLLEDQKKTVNVVNSPENVTLNFTEDKKPGKTLKKKKNEGAGLKIFTPNKLLTRLPILFASKKIKNKIK